MKNADMPAMPQSVQFGKEYHADFDGNGLTKREEFAKAAMQGLCATTSNPEYDKKRVAQAAVSQADALLAELDKPEEP